MEVRVRVRWLVALREGLVVRGIAHRGAERGEEYETRIVTARHGLRRLRLEKRSHPPYSQRLFKPKELTRLYQIESSYGTKNSHHSRPLVAALSAHKKGSGNQQTNTRKPKLPSLGTTVKTSFGRWRRFGSSPLHWF